MDLSEMAERLDEARGKIEDAIESLKDTSCDGMVVTLQDIYYDLTQTLNGIEIALAGEWHDEQRTMSRSIDHDEMKEVMGH